MLECKFIVIAIKPRQLIINMRHFLMFNCLTLSFLVTFSVNHDSADQVPSCKIMEMLLRT